MVKGRKELIEIDQLDMLFDAWREEHRSEPNFENATVSTPITAAFPLNRRQCLCMENANFLVKIIDRHGKKYAYYPPIERDSFVKDGAVCMESYQHAQKKILFLLKEANIQTYRKKGEIPSQRDQRIWYQKYAFSELYQGNPVTCNNKRVDNRAKQLEKIARMACFLLTENLDPTPEELQDAICQVAFLNLNKRGGNNSEKIVRTYTKRYREYICREIELLSPDSIVCLGTYKYLSLLPDISGASFINMGHTGCRFPGKFPLCKFILKSTDKNIKRYMELFVKRTIR